MAKRSSSGGWIALAASLLGALLKPGSRSSGGAGSEASPRGDSSRQAGSPKQPRARLKQAQPGATAQPRSGTAHEAEGSPGQFGPGSTRDLTAAEIKSLKLGYDPHPDSDPDPGEVVWTWVPFAEHDGRGKDRPVLVIGRIGGGAVAGVYLSTKHHRDFIAVGTGPWDSQGRESYLSPERLLRVTADGMRREGHALDRERYVAAVSELARVRGLA